MWFKLFWIDFERGDMNINRKFAKFEKFWLSEWS